MTKISIVDMSGARNRGCEALVLGALAAVDSALDGQPCTLDLHTEDPNFDVDTFGGRFSNYFRQYPLLFSKHHYNRNFNKLLYSSLSLTEMAFPSRLGRFKSLSAMRKSDLLIVTGGDVITSDYAALTAYMSPFNVGKPVVLLGHTIGPFVGRDERYFRESYKSVELCTVRESISYRYLTETLSLPNVVQVADLAFLLPAAPIERVREILEDEHRFALDGDDILTLSVSAGILAFRKDTDGDAYFREIVRFVDEQNDKGYRIVFIPHVQEKSHHNNDLYACLTVLRRLRRPGRNVVLATPLSASDFKGVIGQSKALLGARTHATIAAMSQGIPTVALAYSRKAWGIMADYYGDELARQLTMDVAEMSAEKLEAALSLAMTVGHTPDKAAEMRVLAAKNHTELATVCRRLGLVG